MQYFRGVDILILSNTQYFRGIDTADDINQYAISNTQYCGGDTAYTKHYAVFDTPYIKQYAVFSGDRYCLY